MDFLRYMTIIVRQCERETFCSFEFQNDSVIYNPCVDLIISGELLERGLISYGPSIACSRFKFRRK